MSLEWNLDRVVLKSSSRILNPKLVLQKPNKVVSVRDLVSVIILAGNVKNKLLGALDPNYNSRYSLDGNFPLHLLLFKVVNMVSSHEKNSTLLKAPKVNLNHRVAEDDWLSFEVDELLVFLSTIDQQLVSRRELGFHKIKI